MYTQVMKQCHYLKFSIQKVVSTPQDTDERFLDRNIFHYFTYFPLVSYRITVFMSTFLHIMKISLLETDLRRIEPI